MIHTNDIGISSYQTSSRSVPRNKNSSYLGPLVSFGIISIIQRGKHMEAIGDQMWEYGYILNYGNFKKFLTTK